LLALGHKGIEKVQGNPAVHEVGKRTKQRNTIAVTTRRNEGANDGLEWARKSRFGTLPLFNPAFLMNVSWRIKPLEEGTPFADHQLQFFCNTRGNAFLSARPASLP
jgi:hypothetical protein